MAARRLQTEIDLAIKKVAELVESFDNTYDKLQASNNAAQKEKLEGSLKNQIKKLQRLRDQIRTWAASNEIKDKDRLLEQRRLIEAQMEKFKACEKEVKKKAFSNLALGEAVKLDPKEQETMEMVEWLDSQLEKLQMQIEQTEAEIESVNSSTKKKAKAGSTTAERVEKLEGFNARRKLHIGRLEIVLRMLNNGTLEPEKVKALQDDVSYFVESNAEEDFTENDELYDDLNLDEEEEKYRGSYEDANSDDESEAPVEDVPPSRTKKNSEDSSKRADSPILKKANATPARTKPTPNFTVQPMSSLLKPSAPRPPVQLPPIRYSAAVQQQPQASSAPSAPPATAAAASAPTPTAASVPASAPAPAPAKSKSGPPPATPSAWSSIPDTPSSPSMTHPSVASPMSSYASVSHGPESSFYESPALSEAVPSVPSIASPTRVLEPLPAPSPEGVLEEKPLVESPEERPVDITPAPRIPPPEEREPIAAAPPPQAIGSQRPSAPAAVNPGSFPVGLADLVMPFERAKQRATQRLGDLDQLNKYLASGVTSIPQPQDTRKTKAYAPRNPYPTARYYPQTQLPLLEDPSLYSRIDVETLFYIFYFLPVSYPQYLAAEELKRQSWRFHVKYLTWFQRHSEPQAITEEYEQGVYVYFDWEGSWCQRKKSDFRFEYRYLAEE
ncbi:unnamed protein product [Mycena citricolor]|uniref:General negative regulator of transcription subunit n=1 Tax=Mycena citricolor TaxID=2018698 RepID=A0AAD2JWP5_9AGAR|nr:unnamed protein product [Mycena citricolor]